MRARCFTLDAGVAQLVENRAQLGKLGVAQARRPRGRERSALPAAPAAGDGGVAPHVGAGSAPELDFPPVRKRQAVQLRLSDTCTASQSYHLDGLVFDRSSGRLCNTVVLPRAWHLTWLSTQGSHHRSAVERRSPTTISPCSWCNGDYHEMGH